jgi:hypothetical protein
MTAYSGLRLIASASGLLSRPMPRADSRNAAGAFLFGRRRCPLRSETCPEGCKVYAGSLLIPAAVGAYCENGPVGAAINPRRVRLIARRG